MSEQPRRARFLRWLDGPPNNIHSVIGLAGLVLIAVLVVAAVSTIGTDQAKCHGNTPTSTAGYVSPDAGDEFDAYLMAQQFTERQLVSPGSADFPSLHSPGVSVERRGDVWVVKSYVDSQNRFGAMLRSRFTCRLRHVGGDKWRCESLVFH